MVRTKNVIQDNRILLSAIARSRLGFYAFGKSTMFENIISTERTMKLEIVPNETYPTKR